MRLQGKVVLITGGDRGIGRAITERFAREGADVVINFAHNEAEAKEALATVESSGRRGLIVQADMSSYADVQKLIDESVGHFVNLDILVNNAGVETNAPFLDATEADYDKVVGVNLKGVFLRHPGVCPAPGGREPAGQGHHHQLGS